MKLKGAGTLYFTGDPNGQFTPDIEKDSEQAIDVITGIKYNWDRSNDIWVAEEAGGTVSGSTLQWYDAGNGAYVKATGLGVTFTNNAGTDKGTFTTPAGVKILDFKITGDASFMGATNDYFIEIPLVPLNTNENNYWPPTITLINETSKVAGGLATAPFVYDSDSVPQKQIVDVDTGVLTIAIINLKTTYTNWAILGRL